MHKTQRIFWFKHSREFYARPVVRVIEKMPLGLAILFFYQKLLTYSLDYAGVLTNQDFPNLDNEVIALWVGLDIELVNTALPVLVKMGLVQSSDSSLVLPEYSIYVASESISAARKRKERERKSDIVTTLENTCHTDKERYSDTDKDREREKEVDRNKSKELPKVMHLVIGKGTKIITIRDKLIQDIKKA